MNSIALSTEQVLGLPQRLRSTNILWRSGDELRDTIPKAMYCRHRKGLLEYCIDIALLQENTDRSNMVPLVPVLEAEPSAIPHWAFAEGMIHVSARH
jgi:II/X family phage/plasmid replication protein